MTKSPSRSRSREPNESLERVAIRGRNLHSTGRGGAGNVVADGIAEEDEREKYLQTHEHLEGKHSTGRGGLANITSIASPNVESSPVRPEGPISTGRGGAGNIAGSREHTRSASRGRDNSRGRDSGESHNTLGKVMDRMKEKFHHEKDGARLEEEESVMSGK